MTYVTPERLRDFLTTLPPDDRFAQRAEASDCPVAKLLRHDHPNATLIIAHRKRILWIIHGKRQAETPHPVISRFIERLDAGRRGSWVTPNQALSLLAEAEADEATQDRATSSVVID